MATGDKLSPEAFREVLEDSVTLLEKLSAAIGVDSVQEILDIAKLACLNDGQLRLLMAAMYSANTQGKRVV
jgi:hypothetical protein